MKRIVRFALATLSLASLSLALPALAHAEEGYVTANVNLRAGPDSSYPWIDLIPAGTAVDVQGCTSGWEWCDVITYGNRGWVVGNYIEYPYRNQPVLLPAYGARIGIPIVTFVIATYWDNHYRNRPFYRERDHWYHRRIVRRPPPPPVRYPYRGPIHRYAGPAHRPGVFPSRTPPGQPRGHLGPVGPGHAVHADQGNQPRPAPGHRSSAPGHQSSNRKPAPRTRPPSRKDEHGHKDDKDNGH